MVFGVYYIYAMVFVHFTSFALNPRLSWIGLCALHFFSYFRFFRGLRRLQNGAHKANNKFMKLHEATKQQQQQKMKIQMMGERLSKCYWQIKSVFSCFHISTLIFFRSAFACFVSMFYFISFVLLLIFWRQNEKNKNLLLFHFNWTIYNSSCAISVDETDSSGAECYRIFFRLHFPSRCGFFIHRMNFYFFATISYCWNCKKTVNTKKYLPLTPVVSPPRSFGSLKSVLSVFLLA